MATIQEQIDALQLEIESIEGGGTSPRMAECPTDNGKPRNIAAMNAEISGLKDQITDLMIQQAQNESDFAVGTGMTLRLGANKGNVPTINGTNPSVASKITAIGRRRPPASIVVGDITVSASGNNITLGVSGESDVDVTAQKLASFVQSENMAINLVVAEDLRDGNEAKAIQFMDLSEEQGRIIDEFKGLTPATPPNAIWGLFIPNGGPQSHPSTPTGQQLVDLDLDVFNEVQGNIKPHLDIAVTMSQADWESTGTSEPFYMATATLYFLVRQGYGTVTDIQNLPPPASDGMTQFGGFFPYNSVVINGTTYNGYMSQDIAWDPGRGFRVIIS